MDYCLVTMAHIIFVYFIILALLDEKVQGGLFQNNYEISESENWFIIGTVLSVLVIFLPSFFLLCACGACKIKFNCCWVYSLWNWIILWISLIFVLSCSFPTSCYRNSKSLDFSRWMVLFILPLLYLIMIIECCHVSETRYFSTLTEPELAKTYIQNLRYCKFFYMFF